jgi:hypothetical protein
VSFLPNVFSDPQLRARQDQLDAQWKSLKASYDACNDTPPTSFAEFATDFAGWTSFYDSESDWSSNAKKATDEWQTKAQEWAGKIAGWCGGGADSGIPTVKDPPPDEPGLVDQALGVFDKTRDAVLAPVFKVGWVAVGIVAAVILAIVVIVTKGRAKGYGIEVGGGK